MIPGKKKKGLSWSYCIRRKCHCRISYVIQASANVFCPLKVHVLILALNQRRWFFCTTWELPLWKLDLHTCYVWRHNPGFLLCIFFTSLRLTDSHHNEVCAIFFLSPSWQCSRRLRLSPRRSIALGLLHQGERYAHRGVTSGGLKMPEQPGEWLPAGNSMHRQEPAGISHTFGLQS